MESWVLVITVGERFLHLLEKVDVWRIGLDEGLAVIDDDLTDQAVLGPVLLECSGSWFGRNSNITQFEVFKLVLLTYRNWFSIVRCTS